MKLLTKRNVDIRLNAAVVEVSEETAEDREKKGAAISLLLCPLLNGTATGI